MRSRSNRRSSAPTVARPRNTPDPAGADQPGERTHALVEPFAEDDEGEHQHQPLTELVEPDRGDRSDGPGRVHDVAEPVGELHADPSELVSQQLGPLRQLVRTQVAADASREERGGHPHHGGRRDDGAVAEGIGDETSGEDADEQGDGAADRRDRVGGEQVLGRNQARHDRLRGGEEEPVHRRHEQRAPVVHGRLLGGAREHEEDGRGPQQRGHDHDPSPRPPVDEHPDERPDHRERHDHDRGCQREARGRRRAFGGEGERRDERRLDEAVGGLAHEPNREQPAEVGVAQGISWVPHDGDGPRAHRAHRRAGLQSRWGSGRYPGA